MSMKYRATEVNEIMLGLCTIIDRFIKVPMFYGGPLYDALKNDLISRIDSIRIYDLERAAKILSGWTKSSYKECRLQDILFGFDAINDAHLGKSREDKDKPAG
jgi:hypothetical protein